MMLSTPLVGASISGGDQMDLSAIIRRAIEIGGQHSFVAFEQINELMPSSIDRVDSEAIEALLEALSDRGIDIRDA
jgi:hypothetical protein